MERIAGQLVVEEDGEERLIFYQAWSRRAQLTLRFPIFSFRVTEQKYQ